MLSYPRCLVRSITIYQDTKSIPLNTKSTRFKLNINSFPDDNQEQINSMIKMKLLEMDRVKAVWNKYAANKIIVTIIKSENID
jgi:hypothetical protein